MSRNKIEYEFNKTHEYYAHDKFTGTDPFKLMHKMIYEKFTAF